MNNCELKNVLSGRFLAYARAFAPPGGAPPLPMTVKLDHAFDVCTLMDRIAPTVEPSAHRQWLCWLSALFHDVSRFEQYRDFHTFRDDRSFDHGQRSAEIFARQFTVPSLTAADREIIHTAIFHHNKFHLPDDLEPAAVVPAKALRDADKVSILNVLEKHFGRPAAGQSVTVNFDMPDTPGFTAALAHTALRGECIRNQCLRNVNDFKICLFGWISDFNYPRSATIVLQEELYQKIRRLLPDSALLDDMCDAGLQRLRRLAAGEKAA